jgi:hypothetical protein
MSKPIADQIADELALRAEGGFVHSFTNGGHTTHRANLTELLDAQDRLERREAARRGVFRLAQFNPDL